MFKKSYWLGIQVTMTPLSYKVLCVKFNDIFKTTICLPAFYLTWLQPVCTKHFVSYPHGNDNMSPDNCVHCRKTFLRPVMATSILLYIVKTYVCITILTFLRHALLCVQCKNGKFFNECVKY